MAEIYKHGNDYIAIGFINMGEINTMIDDLKKFKKWARKTESKWPHIFGMVSEKNVMTTEEVQQEIAALQVSERARMIVLGYPLDDRDRQTGIQVLALLAE